VNRDNHVGGARLLFGDGILAFLLLNEARHRIVAWVFGVAKENSNLVTILAIGAVAEVLSDKAPPIRRPTPPSIADTAIGAGALNEIAHRIAGDSSRDTPFFGALVAFALLGRSFRPMLRESFRSVRGLFRGVIAGSRRVRALLEGAPSEG
jgi:hypothetical protein